jgi:hypothetical protein
MMDLPFVDVTIVLVWRVLSRSVCVGSETHREFCDIYCYGIIVLLLVIMENNTRCTLHVLKFLKKSYLFQSCTETNNFAHILNDHIYS